MKPKTELFLYQMLWTAERLARPAFRNLDESFEGWAYRNGLLRQVHQLEADGFLESRSTSFEGRRVHRLTEAGRLAALGGRDPAAGWEMDWDRKWRLFMFDIPESQRSLRRKLTRSLAAMGCGCLQGSVWICASRPMGVEAAFPEHGEDCSHLMILEAESRGLDVDLQMVQAAWDFEKINEFYQRHISVLGQLPKGKNKVHANALAGWAKKENEAWLRAVRSDPLLPEVLLPKGYLGRKAWRQRQTILGRAGRAAEQVTAPGDAEA